MLTKHALKKINQNSNSFSFLNKSSTILLIIFFIPETLIISHQRNSLSFLPVSYRKYEETIMVPFST